MRYKVIRTTKHDDGSIGSRDWWAYSLEDAQASVNEAKEMDANWQERSGFKFTAEYVIQTVHNTSEVDY